MSDDSRRAQARPGQARAGQGRPGQSRSDQARAGQGGSGQSRSGQSRPGQSRSGQARAGQGHSIENRRVAGRPVQSGSLQASRFSWLRRRATPGRRPVSLDTPLETRRAVLPTPQVDPEVFGRGSERFARFMGTAQFIAYMTAFVAIWLAWNTYGPQTLQFDPRALNYTLLTLILSLQASYAAPLILLAQNRQADRDRVSFEQDRQRSERNLADTEYLAREVAALRIALRDVATRDFLRSELRDLIDELAEARDGDPTASEGGTKTAGKGGKLGKSGSKARKQIAPQVTSQTGGIPLPPRRRSEPASEPASEPTPEQTPSGDENGEGDDRSG